MVMWNLVGHGVKWAARGLHEFSKTDAGRRLGELTSRAYSSSRDLTREAVARYRNSSPSDGSLFRTARKQTFRQGDVVVLPNGEVALVIRYVERHEIGGTQDDRTPTELLVVGLLQTVGDEDQFVVIAQSSLRKVADGSV